MNPVAKESQKGCGMLVVVSVLVLGSLFLIPSRFLGQTMIPELIAIMAIVLAVQVFSKRMALARIALARAEHAKKRHEEVIELLEPFTKRTFIWTNSRFDRSGEALWMLLQAYANQGETGKAKQLQAYLVQHRRGEYAEKARAWTPSPSALR